MCVDLSLYIYIYMYIYTHISVRTSRSKPQNIFQLKPLEFVEVSLCDEGFPTPLAVLKEPTTSR